MLIISPFSFSFSFEKLLRFQFERQRAEQVQETA